jgi:hypothetical protein
LADRVKGFNPLTLVGAGLIIVFLVFCFISTLAVRWWLMVPIALASFVLLSKSKGAAAGLEKNVCVYGIWAIIALFILRDIYMAHSLAALLDTFSGATKGLENIFNNLK